MPFSELPVNRDMVSYSEFQENLKVRSYGCTAPPHRRSRTRLSPQWWTAPESTWRPPCRSRRVSSSVGCRRCPCYLSGLANRRRSRGLWAWVWPPAAGADWCWERWVTLLLWLHLLPLFHQQCWNTIRKGLLYLQVIHWLRWRDCRALSLSLSAYFFPTLGGQQQQQHLSAGPFLTLFSYFFFGFLVTYFA